MQNITNNVSAQKLAEIINIPLPSHGKYIGAYLICHTCGVSILWDIISNCFLEKKLILAFRYNILLINYTLVTKGIKYTVLKQFWQIKYIYIYIYIYIYNVCVCVCVQLDIMYVCVCGRKTR